MSRPPMTRDEVRAFDRDAIERLGLPGLVLMENAGRGCVDVLERVGIDGPVVVLCGKGNNGGDGFVIARHLVVRGHACRVVMAAPPNELAGDALTMFETLTHCGLPIFDSTGVNPALTLQELDAFAGGADWIVDALLGTGASGDPRPPFDTLIDWVNGEPGKRLAVDLPSGLDCDTGRPGSPTVRADHTCSFVAPKVGFSHPDAAEFVGEVHVLDIGAPYRSDSSG